MKDHEDLILDELQFLKFVKMINPIIAYFGLKRVELAKDVVDRIMYDRSNLPTGFDYPKVNFQLPGNSKKRIIIFRRT